MRRWDPQSTAGSSSGPLWESLPEGAALWRAFRRYVKACGRPPGWSWPDWWQEAQSVCLLRALEASEKFDPARGVPKAAFLCKQMRYALGDCCRREHRFAARCHAECTAIPEPANREENVLLEDWEAVRMALGELPGDSRRLLERLVLEGESEVQIAWELGLNQSTISRRRQELLGLLRARVNRTGKKI